VSKEKCSAKQDEEMQMPEERILEVALKSEIEASRFGRAATLAKSSALPLSEVKELRKKALWQMAAVFRNTGGARVLCEQYGFTKKEAEEILGKLAEEQQGKGDTKILEPTYDQATGKYLTFAEWLDQFLKHWEKFPPS
jgi:hypothetical protein